MKTTILSYIIKLIIFHKISYGLTENDEGFFLFSCFVYLGVLWDLGGFASFYLTLS